MKADKINFPSKQTQYIFNKMFIGNSKLNISYRGVDKTMSSKNNIIRQANEERKVRELQAKQRRSSIIIQSWFRKNIARRKIIEQLKNEFDFELNHDVNSITKLFELLRMFICAYKLGREMSHEYENYKKLISLSIKMLQMSEHICEMMMRVKKIDDGDEIPFSYLVISIKKLLEISCRFISCHASQHSVCLEVPLQVLKEFTSVDSYLRGTSSKMEEAKVQASKIVLNISNHLCTKGYFSAMKTLVENRTSITDFHHSDEKLMGFIIHFLNKNIRSAYQNAAIEIFSELTDQSKIILLPGLTNHKFPFNDMVETLLKYQSMQSLSINQTLNWLYCILILGEPHYVNMDCSQFFNFIELILNLISYLEEIGKFGMNLNRELKDHEEVPKDCVQMKKLCFDLIGENANICKRLKKFVNVELVCLSSSEGYLSPICKIVYKLFNAKFKEIPEHCRLLRVLACSPTFMRKIWGGLEVPKNLQFDSCTPQKFMTNNYLCSLFTFCNAYSFHLTTVTDADMMTSEAGYSNLFLNSKANTMPFSGLRVISSVALALRNSCLELSHMIHLEAQKQRTAHSQEIKEEYSRVLKEVLALTKHLYERNFKIKFCSPDEWAVRGWSSNFHKEMLSKLSQPSPDINSGKTIVVDPVLTPKVAVLRELPFVINFHERIELFKEFLNKHKKNGILGHGNQKVTIRRDFIYEDAFLNLNKSKVPDMRDLIQFSLINSLGAEEVGIDGGGVFRETLREIIKTGFNPNLGFFKETPDGHLYPNHLAEEVNTDYLRHYCFLGRILGKAIFAKLLVDVPLASFFVVKLLAKENESLDIHHLSSLDPELHKNLLYIKGTKDINDLELYFNIEYEALGSLKTVDLVDKGSSKRVDNNNKHQYIRLVADWHLNKNISAHCEAFKGGLSEVVDIEWLKMFGHNELQFLISGANVPIDLDDLKYNTIYSGTYTADHEVIKNFWSVLEGFTETQKQDFLKFVTCSPRAPLYGFKELRPSFCIHFAGNDTDRLPTSSTCMNLLKLPAFQDKKILNEKLLKAIEFGLGFELS